MNSESNINTSNAPKPLRQESVPFGARFKTMLPALVGGMLVGALGMALILPRLRPAVPSSTNAAHETGKGTASKEGAAPAENEGIQLSDEAVATAGIRIETVHSTSLGESLTVPGIVEINPNQGAKITPPASGKIVRLLVNRGDRVKAGQPLVILDSFEVAQAHAALRQAEDGVQQARAAIQTARAEVYQAQSSVKLAQSEVTNAKTRQKSAESALQRQKELAAAGAFSQAPLQAARSELNEAQSELLKSQTEVQSHNVALQRAERLFKEELISRSELEQAQLEHRQDEARVMQAQNRVALAKRTLEREQKVFSGDMLSRQAVQTADAEVRSAVGEVQKAHQGLLRAQQDVRRAQKQEQAARTALKGAEATVRTAESTLYALEGGGHTEGSGGLITISAPLSGVVTERSVTVGEAVERTTSLLLLENLNTVSVVASVPEADLAKVRVGQAVEIQVPSYPGRKFRGVVQSLAGHIDEKTRTLPVHCLVENPKGLLRPEMYAKVLLGIGIRSNSLTVPVSALEEDGDARFLYIQKDGKFERRKVKLGRATESHAEIKEGVKAGEQIAVEGIFVLKSEANKDKLKEEE